MAGLDHYPFAVFIHIVGALGLFAALALEWLAVTQFRRATTASESTIWLRILPYVRRIGPPSMAVIVVPGVAMALTSWNFLAWPAAALLGMAGMIAVGLLLSRRPTQAVLSVEIRIAIALGIVALMVFKPDLMSSLLVLVGAVILGTGASIIAHGGGIDARRKLQPILSPHQPQIRDTGTCRQAPPTNGVDPCRARKRRASTAQQQQQDAPSAVERPQANANATTRAMNAATCDTAPMMCHFAQLSNNLATLASSSSGVSQRICMTGRFRAVPTKPRPVATSEIVSDQLTAAGSARMNAATVMTTVTNAPRIVATA
jgi:hypothetical protein